MQEREVIDAEFVVIREAELPPAVFESEPRDRLIWLKAYWYLRKPHKKVFDAFWVAAYVYTFVMVVIEIRAW